MKRRILSFRIPSGRRYTVIAFQNSTKCRLEITASAVIEYFMGCLVSSAHRRRWGGRTCYTAQHNTKRCAE